MQTKPGEIPILDNLRAVAAWAVCLYHFVCTTIGLVNPDGFTYQIFSAGRYGVHLFFIISGMVIPWSLYRKRYQIKNLFGFLLKRLLRLEPPYIFSIILVLAVIYLRKYSPSYDGVDRVITLKQVLLHFGYLVPFFEGVTWLNNVYWTLAIEFQYYLAIGVLYFMFVSPRLLMRVAAYLLLLAAPFFFPSDNFMPFWLPLFGVGILLFSYKMGIVRVSEWALVTLACLVHLWLYNSPAVSAVAALSAAVILLLFSRSSRILAFFGNFSYSVYLIHPVIGSTFINVCSHYVSGSFAKFMLVLAGAAITGAGSYLMYRLVEKPSKTLSTRLKYK